MLYEYYTDLSRKLNELGRMFVEIHRKETGKNLLDVDEYNRVIKECQRRIGGKEPQSKIILNGYDRETSVRVEIASNEYKSPATMYEDAQFIIGRMIGQKIQDERDEMIRLGERMERIERQRREGKQ